MSSASSDDSSRSTGVGRPEPCARARASARERAQGKRADPRRLSCLPCRREGPRDLSRARSRAGDRSPASPPRRRCRTPRAPAGLSHPCGPWRAPPGTRRRNFRGSARRPVMILLLTILLDDYPCRSRHPRALRGKSDVTCGPDPKPARAAQGPQRGPKQVSPLYDSVDSLCAASVRHRSKTAVRAGRRMLCPRF